MPTTDQTAIRWTPIAVELPPDEQWVLLAGDAGYTDGRPFVVVGRRHEAYRPRHRDGAVRWLDVNNDALTNNGWTPTHWTPLPVLPWQKAGG